MNPLLYWPEFREAIRRQIDFSDWDRFKIFGQKGGDLAADVVGGMILGRSLGQSTIDAAASAAGKWAVSQLFGRTFAATPLGLIGSAFVGGELSKTLNRWFRRPRRKEEPFAKRTVISNSPYDVLATEIPKQQAQLQNQLVREIMANIGSAFGGNRLAAMQAQQSAAQTIAGLLPQFTQQRIQSLLGLTELAARERSEKRRIGTELLANQLQLLQQSALARQQQQNALMSALVSTILKEALGR